jgi:hypothetical protein
MVFSPAAATSKKLFRSSPVLWEITPERVSQKLNDFCDEDTLQLIGLARFLSGKPIPAYREARYIVRHVATESRLHYEIEN